MNWFLNLFRSYKTRQRLLAERYERVARTYGLMAEQAERMCPMPKDVPFVKYARIFQGVYENHGEDVRKL